MIWLCLTISKAEGTEDNTTNANLKMKLREYIQIILLIFFYSCSNIITRSGFKYSRDPL